MATAVRNNDINSLNSMPSVESQPNMGERTVINSSDKIRALCQECRTKQTQVDAANTKRNWISVAVAVIGLALFVIGLALLHSASLAITLPLILVGAFSAYGAPYLSLSQTEAKSYEESAKALEANENGFLPFAEMNRVELKVGNVVKTHELYKWDKWFKEEQCRREKKHHEYLQPRLNELHA